jgi:hypothetical protein
MPSSEDILTKFNTDQILGKGQAGERPRNPTQMSHDNSFAYTINNLTYPEDLTKTADLQHYIAFYINVRGKSKFLPAYKTVDVDVSSQGQNRLGSVNQTEAAIVGGAIGVGVAAGGSINALFNRVLGGAAAKKATSNTKKSGSTGITAGRLATINAVAGGAAAIATGGALGAIAFKGALSPDTPKRITDCIALPIERRPEVRYSMKYDTLDFGMLGGIFGGSGAVDSSAPGRLAEAGAGLAAGLAGLPTKYAQYNDILGLGPRSVREGMMAGAAVQTNPFREVTFKEIDFRTFEFSYTFLPKTKTEVYNVKRIIDLFKFHMHPELSSSGMFYVYPSEFEMVYYFKGKENNFINKISTCVLENMSVSYGSEDYFTSFRDGEPAEIRLKLSFRELELMTKERIVKGY